jgi:hypothetical protein
VSLESQCGRHRSLCIGQHEVALQVELLGHIPLWKPYMFNCRTKEEMLVCLKYDLRSG